MFCEHCGNMLPDRAKFCDSCGAPVKKQEPQQPIYESPSYEAPSYEAPSYPQPYNQVQPYDTPRQPRPSVSFVDAIRLYFLNYSNFHGRSRRSEFWFAALFTGILSALVSSILPDLSGLLSLALLCPNIALAVRRLHDIGKSGWYYLFCFIPLVGPFFLLYWYCQDSEGENDWGPSPKY